MQHLAAIQILTLGAALVFPGSAPRAEAAMTQSFDVGYGWDAGFTYAQPDQLRGGADPAPRINVTDLRAEAVEAVLDPPEAAPRKAVAIPVPGSLVLFGSGLVMLAFAGRRRSSRRSA